jgi:hypothetical protein
MSKTDELRAQYPSVTNATFKKFDEGDKTKTKKYLSFMLKTWVNRSHEISTTSELVKLVNMFDELLPYIENKDVYHKDYENITYFLDVINNAIDKKEEKTFVKNEHINVLYECDNYLLLQPKTFRGSLKYGANTKWCTSSRTNESIFNRYSKGGFLVYLISKTKDKGSNYEKVAFYAEYSEDPLVGYIRTFNVKDTQVDTNDVVMTGGWEVHEIFNIITIYRANFSNWKRTKKAEDAVKHVVSTLSNIDFDFLKKSITILEENNNQEYVSDLKNRINEFIQKIPVNL